MYWGNKHSYSRPDFCLGLSFALGDMDQIYSSHWNHLTHPTETISLLFSNLYKFLNFYLAQIMFVSFYIYTGVELFFFWWTLEDLWVHGESGHFIWCIVIPFLRSRCKYTFLSSGWPLSPASQPSTVTSSQTPGILLHERHIIGSTSICPPHSTHAHFIIMRKFSSEQKQVYFALSLSVPPGRWMG